MARGTVSGGRHDVASQAWNVRARLAFAARYTPRISTVVTTGRVATRLIVLVSRVLLSDENKAKYVGHDLDNRREIKRLKNRRRMGRIPRGEQVSHQRHGHPQTLGILSRLGSMSKKPIFVNMHE